MNPAKSPSWKDVAVDQYKNAIHFFDFSDFMAKH